MFYNSSRIQRNTIIYHICRHKWHKTVRSLYGFGFGVEKSTTTSDMIMNLYIIGLQSTTPHYK